MKNQRRYFSVRSGKIDPKLALDSLKEIFFSIWQDFQTRGYFDEFFGKDCPDGNDIGRAGDNPEGYVLRKIRKNNLWPVWNHYKNYLEEDLFDMIEFLFDHISMPIEKDAFYHPFGGCGYHYKNFDDFTGKVEFTSEINQFLNDYGNGYELSLSGEILSLLEPEFQSLLSAKIPVGDFESVKVKMQEAVNKFRKYGSTLNDRGEAVRSLADVLEYIRPQIRTVLNNKDEGDLFNIVNNFGIRHHNIKQQTNYDKKIWLSWMFYFYLATLHACLHLIKKNQVEIK